jgi:SAM-dependent methyltransferase
VNRKHHSLHRLLSLAVGTFNRNPWSTRVLALVPRVTVGMYAEDGLWTSHGHPFVADPRFELAYARAIQAGGFDYGIRWRVHTILWASTLAAAVDGAFVECGTGRGFMASAICAFHDWQDRPFYLYDTFKASLADGLPPSPYYATSSEAVRRNFSEWPGVQLVEGKLPDTLGDDPDLVAFLHVDLNHAPSDQAVVRHLWPRISPGGVLVYDDYGFPGFESSRLVADELSREFSASLLCSPTGQGVVVKPHSNRPRRES